MGDEATNGFAVVRPPGHHADSDSANGFCIFNNAAQAAEAAFNFGADRILIVDLDVHHGQGTQRIFYDDKRVLYFSIHRFENAKFWPHLAESNFDHIGEGAGVGYTANVPLNETGCGDADYLAILWNVLMPLATQFDPHFVIVSAGFDSCQHDPVGGMSLSSDGYSHLIYQLKSLAQGKMLMILEGGYNHEVSAQTAQRCLRVLLGSSPFSLSLSQKAKESTIASCLSTISVLRNFWPCFDFYKIKSTPRTSQWDIYNPRCFTSIPLEEERKNTENIDQEKLEKVQLKEATHKPAQTLIYYDAENYLHADSSECDHPERPARTESIIAKLRSSQILEKCVEKQNERLATAAELELAHERPLIERVRRTKNMSYEELRQEESRLDSIFLTNDTFDVAARAAGASLQARIIFFELIGR
ncbi:unnamed protein product [Caenorhabditis auriculariae]|uniref:histone deacetylase n=1 Tax=Caenorhabditis auriculariae TaxID=2777116 RepID=A0A8S1H8A3_9PELO|nr:unnamed protein product [Caenorhabditis auriculariae]